MLRVVLVAVALLCAACGRDALTVTFLDVGQGDAVLIQTPDGRTALVDGGQSDPGRHLRARGVHQIDLVVATHPHADHIGGLDDVVGDFPVRAFLDNGAAHDTQTYRRLMEAVEADPSITYLGPQPRTIALGDASIQVLPADPSPGNVNDRSIKLLVRYGEFSVLLTGDAETGALDHLVSTGAVPDVTVLKASHHGSDNGYTDGLLAASRPEVVVISVGARNSYDHPGALAMSAYLATGAGVYRTDQDGSVRLRGFRDGRFRVARER